MRIGLDIMGGDFAPEATVKGAIKTLNQLPENCKLILIGNKEAMFPIFEKEKVNPASFEIVHAPEVIEMGENPLKSYTHKPNSSLAIGFNLLKNNELDGFASAGSTGAVLVGSMYSVKSIPGIIRPCITAAIPRDDGGYRILLDVGINPDCKPDVLYQYAILGSVYTENVYNIKNPRIGLLNIGTEEEKGSLLTKATYELMKNSKDFNFIGNIEGTDIFDNGKVDVIVCDGFTGNVVLKTCESFFNMLKRRNINEPFLEKFNFENYGGTPILGINSTVIVGHGISNDEAIKNMILHTKHVIENKLIEKIKAFF